MKKLFVFFFLVLGLDRVAFATATPIASVSESEEICGQAGGQTVDLRDMHGRMHLYCRIDGALVESQTLYAHTARPQFALQMIAAPHYCEATIQGTVLDTFSRQCLKCNAEIENMIEADGTQAVVCVFDDTSRASAATLASGRESSPQLVQWISSQP